MPAFWCNYCPACSNTERATTYHMIACWLIGSSVLLSLFYTDHFGEGEVHGGTRGRARGNASRGNAGRCCEISCKHLTVIADK